MSKIQYKPQQNWHCSPSPLSPMRYHSRPSPWTSSSNSLSRREFDTILTITDHDCSKAAMFMPCNETIGRRHEWQSYTPLMCFPTTASPRKLSLIGILASLQTSPEMMCSLLGIKQNISTAYHHKQMAKANKQTNPWNNIYNYIAEHIKRIWAAWLQLAQYTWNSWPNTSTKRPHMS